MANHIVLTLEANVEQVNNEIKRLEMIMSHNAKSLTDGVVNVNFNDIGKRAVQLAQGMIDTNNTIESGDMRKNVGYKIEGQQLILYDTQSYSPYIEYGFNHEYAGFVGPWPFLRPAVNMVAAESTGKIEETMANILMSDNPFNVGSGQKLYFNSRKLGTSISSARGLASNLRQKYGASPQGNNEAGFKRFNSISEYSNKDIKEENL